MNEERDLEQAITLLKRGYPVFPIKDLGKKVKIVNTVEVGQEDLTKIMDKPEVLFDRFKERSWLDA